MAEDLISCLTRGPDFKALAENDPGYMHDLKGRRVIPRVVVFVQRDPGDETDYREERADDVPELR